MLAMFHRRPDTPSDEERVDISLLFAPLGDPDYMAILLNHPERCVLHSCTSKIPNHTISLHFWVPYDICEEDKGPGGFISKFLCKDIFDYVHRDLDKLGDLDLVYIVNSAYAFSDDKREMLYLLDLDIDINYPSGAAPS
jgi:hypothetical protein